MNEDPGMIAMVVCVTLLASVCTALLVPLRQRYSKIKPKYFRKVKVKFPSFLFAGIGSRKDMGNVRAYGVIVPMFVLHILGYLLTLALWITVPLLYQYGVDLSELWVAPVVFALFHTVTVVITEAMCLRKSNRASAAERASENHNCGE